MKIFLEGGSEVNRRAYDGKTALVIICCNFGVDSNEEYTISVLTLLLKHNADPNVQDRKGRTAKMYAMRNRKPKSVVDLLLKHDADPLTCDNFSKNAISFIHYIYSYSLYKLWQLQSVLWTTNCLYRQHKCWNYKSLYTITNRREMYTQLRLSKDFP